MGKVRVTVPSGSGDEGQGDTNPQGGKEGNLDMRDPPP